jgi:biotin carboxyl carrier protein/CheY-like chemotaxis protein
MQPLSPLIAPDTKTSTAFAIVEAKLPIEQEEPTQVAARVMLGADQVLLAEADLDARVWLRTVLAGRFALDEVDTGEAALERIAAGGARIVIIGRHLHDMPGEELAARAAAWLVPARRTPVTFLLADAHGEVAPVDDTEIPVFYRLVRGMEPQRVCELLTQATAKLPPLPPRDPDPTLAKAIADHVKAIGEALEPDDAARAAIAAVIALAGADRARCLYCDDETGRVWPAIDDAPAKNGHATAAEEAPANDDNESPVSVGLAGFAVRTGVGVAVPRAADDSLYRAEVDNPGGSGRERLAIQPVAGLDGHIHAVLIAVRDDARPPFTRAELDKLSALAAAWAPYVLQLSMRVEADQIIGDRLDRGPSDMFRQEAIMHLVRRGQRGDVVRVHPGWVRAAYWLVLAALAAAAVYVVVARINQYSEGPAVIRFTGRSELLAHEAGTVSSLDAIRGQHVERGQVLARLHDTDQVAQLRTLDTEFESKLVAYLQAPSDPSVKIALGQARSARDSARISVESRLIRAPHAGTVKEVLVRNGQRVEQGTVVATIVADPSTEGLKLIAFLPGGDRPRLRAHQPLRLRLPGYRDAYVTSEVRGISEVLGAAEARARFLGDRLGDSLPLTGTVVVVEARLTSSEFESDGEHYQLHDGMVGLTEVQMQSRSLLVSVIPGLQ